MVKELSKSTLVRGHIGNTMSGLDMKLLAMPGSLEKFVWWNHFRVLIRIHSEGLPLSRCFVRVNFDGIERGR